MDVETTGAVESTGTGEAAGGAQAHGEALNWSDRAVQRLTQARALGVLAVVIGAVLYAVGEARSTITTNLMSSSGLTLLVVGLVTIVAAVRTRSIAPDQSFVPQPITHPRMWFVLAWGAGIAAAVFLSLLRPPEG